MRLRPYLCAFVMFMALALTSGPGTALSADGSPDAAVQAAIGASGQFQIAHAGQLSKKDSCHRQKSANERHWHHKGTIKRGGPCVKDPQGKTWRLTRNAYCAKERTAYAKDKAEGWRTDYKLHAEALKNCIIGLGKPAH